MSQESEFRKVLALDPGQTTGFAYGYIDTDQCLMRFVCGQQETPTHRAFNELLSEFPHRYLIVEEPKIQGILKNTRAVNPYPIELMGVVKMYEQYSSRSQVFYQGQDKQGSFNNDLLKHHGCYERGMEHARSATKHLLHWYYFGRGYEWNVIGPQMTSRVDFEDYERLINWVKGL